jgi:uncharacterized membrane protein (DUF485 family)
VKLRSFRRFAIEYTVCLLDVYCYTNVLAQVFPKVLGCVLCGLGEIVTQTYVVNLAVCFLQVYMITLRQPNCYSNTNFQVSSWLKKGWEDYMMEVQNTRFQVHVARQSVLFP